MKIFQKRRMMIGIEKVFYICWTRAKDALIKHMPWGSLQLPAFFCPEGFVGL